MGINKINVYYSILASIRCSGQSNTFKYKIQQLHICIYSLIYGDENISIFEIIKTMKIFKTSEGPTPRPDYKLNS